MLLSRLRLVTFDVTDTLLKFKLSPGEQYGQIGALYGVNCDKKELTKSFKKQWYYMNSTHPNYGRDSGLGWENWWKTIVIETFKGSKAQVEDETLNEIANHLIELYKINSCWTVCDGVNGILSYIRSKRVPMGIISNFDPRLNITLSNFKLSHYFNFIMTSYEAGSAKPNPAIFKKALIASNIKNLRPEQCLHIGDQVNLDYNGAKSSGWNAVIINDKFKCEDYPNVDPKYVFKDLYSLHKCLVKFSEEDLDSQSL